MVISNRKYPPANRGKIVVWSLLATFPFGGMTWHRLHYLVGLRRLGFDVWYVEDSDKTLHSPENFWPTSDYRANVEFLSRQMERIGLGDRWIFRPPEVWDRCFGAADPAGLKKLYRDADAVINLSGAQELRSDHSAIRCLIYLETDPVANQIKVANGDQQTIDMLDSYDHLFTYGYNIGQPVCPVPVEKFTWQPTRPPVCLDWWDGALPPPESAALTTVAGWKHGGKDIVWQGDTYRWSKHHEFLRFIDLPSRSRLPLELALVAISPDRAGEMRRHGWRIIPSTGLADPDEYREYIRCSLGEFTVAKDQNIRLNSGWFSDRSTCYLAAGRPVIMQDTGFGASLPTGRGLFSFSDEAEALAAIDAVATDYTRHSEAALEIAREYFDAENVLKSILKHIGLM